jgi:XTP/dITP diphosphohydrolase
MTDTLRPPPAVLLIATTNAGKLNEIGRLLDGLTIAGAPVVFRTLADGPPGRQYVAPEETGRTFAENARLKALYYGEATALLTVAEDSGLEIDALGGAPGIESARFGGVSSSYPEKFALIYKDLALRHATASTARFVCALAVADAGRVLFEARGTIEGLIAPQPKGDGGFGYDPIFFYPPFGCTLAEAGDRKSSVSHRGEAFRQLRKYLEKSG